MNAIIIIVTFVWFLLSPTLGSAQFWTCNSCTDNGSGPTPTSTVVVPTSTPRPTPKPTPKPVPTAAPLPPIPLAVFECFSKVQFQLINGLITNTCWPSECFAALGFPQGTLDMDLTYIYNWQEYSPGGLYADQYLALAWNQHCATCINPPGVEYSQTYPYTYVYSPGTCP